MAKRTYAAMLEPGSDGGFGVSFPDLPGCVSYGDTLDEAVSQAHEALSLHLEGMVEDGEALPTAGHMGDQMLAPDVPAGVVWAAITVEAPDKGERVNVYLPSSLLERIDRFAVETGLKSRSVFFGLAARQFLNNERGDAGQFGGATVLKGRGPATGQVVKVGRAAAKPAARHR